MELQFKHLQAHVWKVTVSGPPATEHTVTVPAEYANAIAPGLDEEELLRRSFQFLLQREPNTSILRSFELPVIERYFPEYRTVIKQKKESAQAEGEG